MTGVNSSRNDLAIQTHLEIEQHPELVTARIQVALGQMTGMDYRDLYHKIGVHRAARVG
jgi:hypothetical protein